MFQISTMANLETEFRDLLTRPSAKHDEEMSNCPSSPKVHDEYYLYSMQEVNRFQLIAGK